MRLPDPRPILDENRAPIGPEILSSTGAGVWRNTRSFPETGPNSVTVMVCVAGTNKSNCNRFWQLMSCSAITTTLVILGTAETATVIHHHHGSRNDYTINSPTIIVV